MAPVFRLLFTAHTLTTMTWVASLLLIVSCDDNDTERTTVYVGGYAGAVGKEIATYWVDQKEVRVGDTTERSMINALFVQGSDVYAAGFETDRKNGKSSAVYWKNGNRISLLTSVVNKGASIHALYVSGSDVHALGTTYHGSLYAYYYWKNGELIMSSLTGSYNAITVSNGDVYIAGAIDGKAVYWKNGIPQTLENGTLAQSISIEGSDIYVLGYEETYGEESILTITTHKYWKNGKQTILGKGSDNDHHLSFRKIVAVSGDVYVCGGETFVSANHDYLEYASYWKNGAVIHLNNGVEPSSAIGIAVHGNDVYTAVMETNGATHKPVTWLYKNQTPIRLSDPAYRSRPTCLFLSW